MIASSTKYLPFVKLTDELYMYTVNIRQFSKM